MDMDLDYLIFACIVSYRILDLDNLLFLLLKYLYLYIGSPIVIDSLYPSLFWCISDLYCWYILYACLIPCVLTWIIMIYNVALLQSQCSHTMTDDITIMQWYYSIYFFSSDIVLILFAEHWLLNVTYTLILFFPLWSTHFLALISIYLSFLVNMLIYYMYTIYSIRLNLHTWSCDAISEL